MLVADPATFMVDGWIYLEKTYGLGVNTRAMRQQWACHVLGGLVEWGEFDMELYRKSNPDWVANMPGRVLESWPPAPSNACNWK
jgi:hypothetical protein